MSEEKLFGAIAEFESIDSETLDRLPKWAKILWNLMNSGKGLEGVLHRASEKKSVEIAGDDDGT